VSELSRHANVNNDDDHDVNNNNNNNGTTEGNHIHQFSLTPEALT
jgi:hypothetical protein